MDITWTISQLERTLPDSVVYTAHWRVNGTDQGVSGSVYGTLSFPAKDPSDPTFIQYSDLTEEIVVGWVKEAMGAEQVAAHEASVAAQIDAQLNPTSASGLPW